MSEAKERKPLRITLDVGNSEPEAWDQVSARVSMLVDRHQAVSLLRTLLDVVAADKGDDATCIDVDGVVYMSGHLPEKAVFDATGNAVQGAFIVDEVHGWPPDDGKGER